MGGHRSDGVESWVRWAVLLLVVAAGAGGAVQAAEVSGEAKVAFLSRYVWRGVVLSEGVVLQPEGYVEVAGFYADVWSNLELDTGESNEIDFTFGRAWEWKGLQWDAGYILYWPANYPVSQEVYLSVGWETWVTPKVTVYYDFDEGDGAFIQAELEKTWTLPREIELVTGANTGFDIQHKILGSGSAAEAITQFYNMEFYAALAVPLSERISLGGQVAYSFPLTAQSKAALSSINWDGEADVLWGGVTLTVSF